MTRRFSSADIGTIVATLVLPPTTPADLARYAQASGDTNPLHLDVAFARKAGFADLVVHGMLGMAQLGRLLTDTFPAASIRAFNVRFCAVILVGEQVSCQATLAGIADGAYALTLDARTAAGVMAITGDAVIDSALAGR